MAIAIWAPVVFSLWLPNMVMSGALVKVPTRFVYDIDTACSIRPPFESVPIFSLSIYFHVVVIDLLDAGYEVDYWSPGF